MKVAVEMVEELVRRCMLERIIDPAEVLRGHLDIDELDEAKAVEYLAEDALFEFTDPDRRRAYPDLMGDTMFTLALEVYERWSEIRLKSVLRATKLIEEYDVSDMEHWT